MLSFVTTARRLAVLAAFFVFALSGTTLLAQNVTFGPGLHNALMAASPADELTVIVSFQGDGPLTAMEQDALRAVGVRGLVFRSLPIAGVVATPGQVERIAALPGVRSVWLNTPLEYENDGATALTGVDRLRTDANLRNAMGLPFSGKGVGVLVNDSGVDGTHRDLEFGSHVVQNVAAQTNLHSLDALLPVTYTEDVPNTDIGGGHGTHVAGIIGGTGAMSGGKYEGVAPGAGIVGYGSGAGLFILDTIGGFDYALTHQYEYNIRVVSNSFGSTSDTGTPFEPDDPTNIATKMLADRGVVVVFSAGNSGSGEATITGNFKKAPWVVMVAAGDKDGNLADFSSRGERGRGGTVTIDGETFAWEDRPTVTAPGVDIVSTNASTGSNGPDPGLDPAHALFYTTLSGTSMACPHVSGIVALMLEANPRLGWREVKQILQETATNMPGRAGWEAGAGYVNAYAAVVRALERRTDFGRTLNLTRTFNSNTLLAASSEEAFSVDFSPVGETGSHTFHVDAGVSLVSARAVVDENTVAVVLLDPAGNRYGSAISLPLLGPTVGVTAPGMEGEWTLTVRGIGSVSGVALDPLGLTNGTALPGTVDGTIKLYRTAGYSGLDDVDASDPAAAIQYAVATRLMDGYADGTFRPDAVLTRGRMADYLVMGLGIRQYLPVAGGFTYGDVPADLAPFVEAVTAHGAALKDRNQAFDGVMRAAGTTFAPDAAVTRADLAYALVQSLGLQAEARSFDGAVTVSYEGKAVAVDDAGEIPAGLKGYVQLALDLQLVHAYFRLEQGPFDLNPTVKASFRPAQAVTRAEYAVVAGRYADAYVNGFVVPAPGGSETEAGSSVTVPVSARATATEAAPDVPSDFTLGQNYPNPFNPATQIRFTLPEAASVRLTVFDLLGRQVRVLVDGEMAAGTHDVRFDAGALASGTYLYRLETPARTVTKQMVLMK